MSPQFEGTIDAFPEFGKSREELLARARELGWYHSLRLDESLTTEGYFTLDEYAPYYLMPESLAGLDCLDVGTGNGHWSFLMERRGAHSVTATDIGAFIDTDFSRVHGEPLLCAVRTTNGEYGEPYRIAATLLRSGVTYRTCSVYDLRPEDIGEFDLVFSGSMLMHLFAPLLALQRMAAVCRNSFLLTTQTEIALDGESVTAFLGHQIPYVHFVPSPSCLVDMVRCCGYERVLRGPTFHLRLRDQTREPSSFCHTALIALKDAAHPAIPLPEARRYRDSERAARIEIVSGPRRVHPGQVFDLIVRVENAGGVAWRAATPGELRLDSEIRSVERRGATATRASPRGAPAPFVDFLPAGLSTLARLRVAAPTLAGAVSIRPTVIHGGDRFETNEAVQQIEVDPSHRAETGAPPRRWPGPVLRAIRRTGGRDVVRSAIRKLWSRLR